MAVFYTFIDESDSAKEQHEAAHGLLRAVLKKHYKIENYIIDHGAHGKPYLADHPDLHFNLSHCCGLVLCGVSESNIGVDAELIRPYSGNAAKRIFTDTEAELIRQSEAADEMFFRLWTLKEALGKNIGTGISGMKSFEFFFEDGKAVCINFPEKNFTQTVLNKKWAVSVCADSRESDFFEINRNVFCF
ncbi:MAG: 4'-phosphopantetheinyl transferase family protein [Oscillospiraceae bacterium]